MRHEPSPANPSKIAEDFFRHEGARLVAGLTSHLGTHRLQLAEDAVQEALIRALQTWPYKGVPENPAAWLTQTARNVALDHLRREKRWNEKEEGIAGAHDLWLATPGKSASGPDSIEDDTLRMLFVCCHPQLSREAQMALALRTLCGLSPAEIATAFLTSEAAISKRLVRTRQRIRELGLPFEVPGAGQMQPRLGAVLETLYLLFNEGYKATAGTRLVKRELCHEAIRLCRLLTANAQTTAPGCHALLALMLMNASRLEARIGETGFLLRLHEQNRCLWDSGLIREGLFHLERSASGAELTRYHLEAGIAACHSTARDPESTNWGQILCFYDLLVKSHPSPVTELNRAVAVARVHGPAAGLDALTRIESADQLENYHLFHAVRGTLLLETGRRSAAAEEFRRASQLTNLDVELEFLQRRIVEAEMESSSTD